MDTNFERIRVGAGGATRGACKLGAMAWLRSILGLLLMAGCNSSGSTSDAGIDATVRSADAPAANDVGGGSADGALAVDGALDTAAADAMTPPGAAAEAGVAMCSQGSPGCPGGLQCLCCPSGALTEMCLCTTRCDSPGQCPDPARPICNQYMPGVPPGLCTPSAYACRWGAGS
jgi:hypothetical protein